jgi:multicomponent Na+:H+ antiporter subunit G
MTAIEWLGAAMLLAGCLFGIIGGIGILRFPDLYTRLHAVGVTDTLCAFLFLGGLACMFGLSLASVKLVLIFFFLWFTSPTSSHALSKAAVHGGLKPWQAGAERRG